MHVAEAVLHRIIAHILRRNGLIPASAELVADVVTAAERDGALSHGLLRLPGYVATLQSGWVDGAAVPVVREAAPGLITVDGRNGFAQVALEAARATALRQVGRQGVVAVSLFDTHHFAALWPDLEPFAAHGLVALTMVNARSRIVVWGGRRTVLGTNPIAFACPRQDGPPVIWDQATSLRAQGELLLARAAGRPVPEGAGIDADGNPTTDPGAILDGGAFLPFGGHKGAGIAFMVEVLAAAFSGGRFGFEDASDGAPGTQTTRAGQFLLLADPRLSAGAAFYQRVDRLVEELRAAGADRLPSDARYRHRAAAQANGIPLSPDAVRQLLALAGEEGPALFGEIDA